MWDTPQQYRKKNSSTFQYQSYPASPNCKRNALDSSGQSTGVQCSPTFGNASMSHLLELGVPYTFTMGMTSQNVSGATWEVAMHDPKNKTTISLGAIFFVDAPMGLPTDICRGLGSTVNPPTAGIGSYTFMEYFAQPRDYTSAATWSDFSATGPGGKIVRPSGIASECCDRGDLVHGDKVNGSSSTCLPPECTSPAIHFTMGPYLQIPEHVLEQNNGCGYPPPTPECAPPPAKGRVACGSGPGRGHGHEPFSPTNGCTAALGCCHSPIKEAGPWCIPMNQSLNGTHCGMCALSLPPPDKEGVAEAEEAKKDHWSAGL
jgi:hypothetical protein